MSDKLEKYIREHKDQFEEEFHVNKVWQQVRERTRAQRTFVPKRSRMDNYWKAAAIILLLLSSALLLDKYVINGNGPKTAKNYEETIDEFKEVEGYYMSLIDDKRETLNVKLEEEPSLKKEFAQELGELDSAYTQLKTSLDDGNAENVVDALILNLQLRIEILNRQLMILEQIKDTEHEKVI